MIIDIHSHVIANIDDGPVSITESIMMLKMAIRDGVSDIILTPHLVYRGDIINFNIYQESFNNLKAAIINEGLDIRIYKGYEVPIIPQLYDALSGGLEVGLNGSRYILFEFYLNEITNHTLDIIKNIIRDGFIPIIAHPEKCPSVIAKPDILKGFIDAGARLQITGASLNGSSKAFKNTAYYLIKQNMVSFIASDCHDIQNRRPGLLSYKTLVENEFGADIAQALFCSNARAIINCN